MKTPAEIHLQKEMDEEILQYIRTMQRMAPIRASGVHSFLKRQRGRRVTESAVQDRLDYLESKGLLEEDVEWTEGEGDVSYYKITAKGQDTLDGVVRG